MSKVILSLLYINLSLFFAQDFNLPAKGIDTYPDEIALKQSARPASPTFATTSEISAKAAPFSGKTVITFGTFDLLHIGHVNILKRAKSLGDRLVVGVSTDAFNLAKKNKRPCHSQEERREIIAALRFVDEVFYEESMEAKGEYVDRYGANILVMGDDWLGHFDDIRPGVETVYLPRTPGISTTYIIETIAAKHQP